MNNADGRFKKIAAVLILLARNNANGGTEYLLQKRQNTGFADGMWDFSASGHVEKDDPMSATVCREKQKRKSGSMLIRKTLNLWGYCILLVMASQDC